MDTLTRNFSYWMISGKFTAGHGVGLYSLSTNCTILIEKINRKDHRTSFDSPFSLREFSKGLEETLKEADPLIQELKSKKVIGKYTKRYKFTHGSLEINSENGIVSFFVGLGLTAICTDVSLKENEVVIFIEDLKKVINEAFALMNEVAQLPD